MNKLTIIGNLARDPELRTVRDGISVCDFTVAVIAAAAVRTPQTVSRTRISFV